MDLKEETTNTSRIFSGFDSDAIVISVSKDNRGIGNAGLSRGIRSNENELESGSVGRRW